MSHHGGPARILDPTGPSRAIWVVLGGSSGSSRPDLAQCRTQSGPAVSSTFEAHVSGVESDKRGLPHVAGELQSKGFWVGGGQRQHLLVFGQRGEDPAAQREERRRRGAA